MSASQRRDADPGVFVQNFINQAGEKQVLVFRPTQLCAALRVRKAADAQLLTNSNIGLSATAKAQLLSGQIDPRLPLLIVAMAHSHPLRIVDFASQSPGGGPASLLRWVDLATTVGAAHLTGAAYLGWIRAFIDAQRAEYRPAWVQQVTLRTGQAVLRIGYGAPSPLS